MYSLLATSVNEAIATLFGLRARMLKNAIIERMLANNKVDNLWKSVLIGFKEFFLEFIKIFIGKREKKEEEKKIGDKFFEHPLIKNNGSSKIFSTPSYLPANNFSTVLIDILKQEFDKRLDKIATYKRSLSSNEEEKANMEQSLKYSSDVIKIKEIIEYYGRYYQGLEETPDLPIIDKETWQILNLHLQDSIYNIDKFILKIEGWFEDSMNRVTGWYKRQTQIILFFIGILMAGLFNADTVQITSRLSNNREAREKLVQLAIQATDKYKDDPRVKGNDNSNAPTNSKTASVKADSAYKIFKQYQVKLDSIINIQRKDLEEANDIIAVGWGDFGMKMDSASVLSEYEKHNSEHSKKKEYVIYKNSPPKLRQTVLESIYQKQWIKYKLGYVWNQFIKPKKFLGFLITAFAIGLGAPFWFDLLNKLVKLRATGKKEDSDNSNSSVSIQQPINVNVNTQSGEEAVG